MIEERSRMYEHIARKGLLQKKTMKIFKEKDEE